MLNPKAEHFAWCVDRNAGPPKSVINPLESGSQNLAAYVSLSSIYLSKSESAAAFHSTVKEEALIEAKLLVANQKNEPL